MWQDAAACVVVIVAVFAAWKLFLRLACGE